MARAGIRIGRNDYPGATLIATVTIMTTADVEKSSFAARLDVDRAASVYGLALALAVVIAGALRLLHLDWLPLDEAEAALALPAWKAAGPGPPVEIPPAPLLFHLERLTFWLFGDGEVAARLVPALAGIVLVLLAARLKPLIGRVAVLALAYLFAVGPLWVFLGRSVSAATLSAVAIVALVGSLAVRGRADRWILPVAAGMALASGGVTFTFLLSAVVFASIAFLQRRQEDLSAVVDDVWPDAAARRAGVLAFAVALVVAATGLLMRLDGFGALLETPAAWLQELADPGIGFWSGFLLPLVSYAPLVLVFGIAGLALAARKGSSAGLFLIVWTSVALVVGFFAGSPAVVVDALLPLTIGAAVALGALATTVHERFKWSEEGVMTGVIVIAMIFALIQGALYANSASDSAWSLMVLAAALSGILIAVYAILWGSGTALRVAGVTTLILLAVAGWANGWSLSYSTDNVLREPMHPRYVVCDARNLVDNLAGASWAATRDPNAASTRVDPALRPSLEWLLRNRTELNWSEPQGEISEFAAIARETGMPQEFGPSGYYGQTYSIVGEWYPDFGRSSQNFLRWWLQRLGPAESGPMSDVTLEGADLYIRVD